MARRPSLISVALEQAVCGLITNAVEASGAGKQIALSVTANRGDCAISIADDGPGMPFADGAAALTPGPTTKPLGVGLGVPFARKVCELHQGRLIYRRREPSGTVACLDFSGESWSPVADAVQ